MCAPSRCRSLVIGSRRRLGFANPRGTNRLNRLRRRLYVDLDDVLCQTVRSLVAVLHSRFERQVAIEEVRDFELARSFGLDDLQLGELMRIAHQPRVLEEMLPVDGARETLSGFSRSGWEVAIVTGRPASAAESSRRWLAQHAMPHDELHFVDKYGRRDWHEAAASERALRLEEIAQMGFAFAIEDSRDMAIHLASQLGIAVALVDQPWNREPIPDDRGGRRIRRCSSWGDVRAHLSST